MSGAYEREYLNKEIKRIIIEERYFTENKYPFTIKPKLSTPVSIVETSSKITGSQISLTPDDNIRDLLGLKHVVLHEKCNLSDCPVDKMSFNNILIECDIAYGVIFKIKRSGIIQYFILDVDPACNYIEMFRGNIQGYMTVSIDFVSKISFELKSENVTLVSFIGQSITFGLSIKKF